VDILAHTLWAGAGIALARRRWPIAASTVAWTLTLAALPDVLHLLPIIGWWLVGDGSLATVRAYAIALPNQEPGLPPLVQLWSHHLHCVMHSAIVAGAVTALLWALPRSPAARPSRSASVSPGGRAPLRAAGWSSWWIPLLGWWSHIVVDVFTHSAEYYAAPVLYPITERGFDGLAWNTPWFMVLNYAALAAAGAWLIGHRSAPRTAGLDRHLT